MRLVVSIAMAGVLSALLPAGASAQQFEIVAALEIAPRQPAGRLAQVAEGAFFGVTDLGGANDVGTVFKVERQPGGEWTRTTVHSFNRPVASDPVGGLIRGRDGNFYGLTRLGGPNNRGTIYRLTADGLFTVLHALTPTEGFEPVGRLVQTPDGFLWGAANSGLIFKVSEGGEFTAVSNVASVVGSLTGGLVLATDGAFYGTSNVGVFRFTEGSAPTIVRAIADANGGLLQGSDGAFYGTTLFGGGPSSTGSVYKLTAAGEFTMLHAFSSVDGQYPRSGLLEAGGAFYGTTAAGHAPVEFGSVYKIDSNGNFQIVAAFGGALGGHPAEVMQASDGLLYGLNVGSPDPDGGAAPIIGGAVFRMALSGSPALLYSLASAGPVRPASPLTELGGEFYGTSCTGGLHDRGTVFKVSAAGVVTTLHSFNEFLGGGCPLAGVTAGPDGNLYGTTVYDGANSAGTIFKLTPAGTFSVLQALPMEVGISAVLGRLTVGADGHLYGARSNSIYDSGAIFRITLAGVYTTLFRFGPTSGTPFLSHRYISELVRGGDGNFYATTNGLAFNGVLRITPAGAVTAAAVFLSPEATYFPLTRASDGRLYGASPVGGPSNAGRIFSMTLAGALTSVHNFNGVDGSLPVGAVAEGSDGRIYGTTLGLRDVALQQFGTVFTRAPNGTLTTLHRFTLDDGAYPLSGVVAASDGAIYGIASVGGPGGGGVIYRITSGSD